MSTCPQKDIHSVYIDGELPEKYRAEYEAHIATCPDCQAALARLRTLHTLLTGEQDAPAAKSSTASSDSVFLEQSFERLQTKMRYTHTISAARNKKQEIAFPAAKWAISAAAAAAVFAVIAVPLHTRAGDAKEEQALTVIANTTVEPLTEKGVVIDGNVSLNKLASLTGNETAQDAENAESSLTNTTSLQKQQTAATIIEQNTVRAQTVSNGMRNPLTAVDTFRPRNMRTQDDAMQTIVIDGNISHKALAPFAVTSGQEKEH